MSHETILTEWLLCWEELTAQGQEPATDDLCHEHPELARELARRIQALKRWNAARDSLNAQATLPEAEPEPAAAGQPLPLVPGYEVLEKIGGGGMGVVYKARQLHLDRLVALKVIRSAGHAAVEEHQRFLAEAAIIATVKHPGIVEVHAFGIHDGLPFFALEFCPAGSLAERLDGTPLPGPEAARIVEQLARATQAAHEAEVVHRDLKPANVLLGNNDTFKLTDFGLAKRLDAGVGLTLSGQVMGTPGYMAPEQAQGSKDVGPAADTYALGAILYECLTGRPPFKAATPLDTLRQVIDDEPVPPSRLQPQVPRDLETICLKCLRKEPGQRYASAGELADDLERFLADRPIRARRNSAAEQGWRWCRRNPVVATLCGVVVLLLTGTAVGGVVLSLRLGKALGEAQEAQREGNRKLFASYVSEADVIRMSRRPGQRFGSLRRIRDALDLARGVGLSEEDRVRLRNIAIAALCLPDVELVQEWSDAPGTPLPEDLDPAHRRFFVAADALKRLPPPAYEVHGKSWFSADGRFVAAATSPYVKTFAVPVRVWRIDGARPLPVLDSPHPVHEQAIAFQPEKGQVAFGYLDGAVGVYDLETRKLVSRLPPGPGPVFCCAFHPRLPRLAVACGQEVAIWDLDKGQRLVRLPHPAMAAAIAWHPHGHRLVTACGDRQLRLWDAETGQPVTPPWPGHRTNGILLTFSNVGDRVGSIDWDGVLRLWDSATGQLLLSVPGGWYPYFSSEDRAFVHSSREGNFAVLRLAGGQEMRALHRPTPRGQESLDGLNLHPNGRLLVAKTETGFGFFDLRTGEQVAFVAGNFWRGLQFDSTGAAWTAGETGLLRWPVRPDGASLSRWLVGPPEWVVDLLWNGQSSFAVDGKGNVAGVPQGNEGALVVHRGPPRRTLRLGPQYDVRSIHLSPDGRSVITVSHWTDHDGIRYKAWEGDTGRLLGKLPLSEEQEFARFSPAGRYFYAGGSRLRHLEFVSLVQSPCPDDNLFLPRKVGQRNRHWLGSNFSPDYRLAAVGTDAGSIQLLDVEKDEEVARLESPEIGNISTYGFSPDGTLLLASGQETKELYVFDLRRIREQLAALDLDWDLPPYPPARPEETHSTLAPPLQVELIDADAATSRQKWAVYESRQTVVRLFLNPFDADAHFRLGARLLEAGKPETAYAHLSAALAFRPDLDEALFPRAQAAFQLRRWADAVEHASRWLEKCNFDTNGRLLRARANVAQKHYQEAISDFSAVLTTNPGSASLHEERARCYAALGKPDLARADRERASQARALVPGR